jgi:hypothetical protein
LGQEKLPANPPKQKKRRHHSSKVPSAAFPYEAAVVCQSMEGDLSILWIDMGIIAAR